MFDELLVDDGSVEASCEFRKQCHFINMTRGLKDIEVNPISINMQQQ